MTRYLMSLSLLVACSGAGEVAIEEPIDPNCPTLALSDEILDWNDLELGEHVRLLRLSHLCEVGDALQIEVILPEGSGFTTTSSEITIEPGQDVMLEVSYRATGYAARQGELWLLTNDPLAETIVIPLTATVDGDQDGDGYTAVQAGGDDCDDRDPGVYPGATESWNGLDDDCNGWTDDAQAEESVVGFLAGGEGRVLGYYSGLGTADFDGDGRSELVVSSMDYVGSGFIVDGGAFESFKDTADRYAQASWTGATSANYFAGIGRYPADVTGDGRPDLIVAGTDYYYSEYGNRAVAVFDGTTLREGLRPWDATVTLSAWNYYVPNVRAGGDMNGDGRSDLAISYHYETTASLGSYYNGAVFIHDVAGASGDRLIVDDADVYFVGNTYYDYLGANATVADLDDDGYADLVVSAPGDDSGATDGGMFYIVRGTSEMTSGAIGAVADAEIQGEVEYGALGWGTEPVVADVTGDGVADLVIGATTEDRVYIFDDASTVRGALDAVDADIVLTGMDGPDYFGHGIAAGDFDGDGSPELAVGAPDGTSSTPPASADPGVVYLYDLVGRTGWLDQGNASARLRASSRTDLFGQTLLAADLDGDGADELIADAPGYEGGGRILFIRR